MPWSGTLACSQQQPTSPGSRLPSAQAQRSRRQVTLLHQDATVGGGECGAWKPSVCAAATQAIWRRAVLEVPAVMTLQAC
eukprot:SAG31_NODE_421_length_15868_cov_8.966453_10_plen_80_part_00